MLNLNQSASLVFHASGYPIQWLNRSVSVCISVEKIPTWVTWEKVKDEADVLCLDPFVIVQVYKDPGVTWALV